LGLAGINAQLGAGAQQQALEQARINAPLQNAINASALMRGYNVPIGTTETFLGPKAGVYAQSPLSQIAGSGSLVKALFEGQGKDASGRSIAGGAYDWLSKAFSNIGNTRSYGGVQSSPAFPGDFGYDPDFYTGVQSDAAFPGDFGYIDNPIDVDYQEYSYDPTYNPGED
jgi:hypothetical protein